MIGPSVRIMQGDALEKLRELPDETAHCVITSPPYWGLRDYCKCKCGVKRIIDTTSFQSGNHQGGPQTNYREKEPDTNCPICNGTGIIEGVGDYQLGLEKTPEEYAQKLVEIFREVRRVLRGDGTVWLNLGDSYAGGGPHHGSENLGKSETNRGSITGMDKFPPGLKPKDLCMIPARVALALQADGWYLRSDIIWNKPNPMPESCRDRPTKSHEYIFLLTKSSRYFFDQEAVREPQSWNGQSGTKNYRHGLNARIDAGMNTGGANLLGRNIRSVWTMTTKPYSEAHFATFPPELPERCIKAGTSLKGCCPKCGAPWARVVEKNRPEGWKDSGPTTEKEKELRDMSKRIYGGNQKSRSISDIFDRATKSAIETVGWQPTCSCGIDDTIPCTVLDIFAGSGTTGEVARNLGRNSILIELNPEYITLIEKRTNAAVKALESYEDEVV